MTSVRRVLLWSVLAGLLATVVVIAGVWAIWGVEEFSWHGLAAMVLTVFGVTVCNVALIFLMRFSSTSGRDEEAYEGEEWTAASRKETGWQDY